MPEITSSFLEQLNELTALGFAIILILIVFKWVITRDKQTPEVLLSINRLVDTLAASIRDQTSFLKQQNEINQSMRELVNQTNSILKSLSDLQERHFDLFDEFLRKFENRIIDKIQFYFEDRLKSQNDLQKDENLDSQEEKV